MENKEILNESISDIAKGNFDNSLILDNKLCFMIGDTLYRVRMPNQGEQSLAEHKRNLIQLDYLQQEGCITKSQLIAKLKQNNVIDIEKLEESREILTKELKKFWFMLATKDSADKSKISEYSEKISQIQDNLQNLSLDIATYLSPCLESRLEKFYLEYLTHICTEERFNDEWKRIWNNFDEFAKADTILTNKAIANMTWLLLNRR